MSLIMEQVIKALDSKAGEGYLTLTDDEGKVVMKLEVGATTLAIWYYEYLDDAGRSWLVEQ